jgi:pre-mRNA cleavage complex 2 protein Pcf11
MSSAGVTTPSSTASPAMDRESKEVYEEYLSSLGDLNVNSKPLINMLTILAEENIERAAVIVQAVDHHIAKVLI